MKVGLLCIQALLINSKFEYLVKIWFEFCIIHFKSGLLKQRMKSIIIIIPLMNSLVC